MKNPVRYAIGTMSLRVLRRAGAAIAVTSALIFGAGPLAAAPANAATQALPPSVLISNAATGLCLDETSLGGQVLLDKCGAPGTFEHWRVFVYSGHVKINLRANIHYCLNAVVGNGGVTVKRCRSNDANQNFVETPVAGSFLFKTLENLANGKCLDTWLAHGTRVANCNSVNTHQWWL